ncbi:MAG: hypothetical protein CMM01_00750 [Rhodopirellula sp.]|nr:hypothetical protein [Rhodopirellula sp.]
MERFARQWLGCSGGSLANAPNAFGDPEFQTNSSQGVQLGHMVCRVLQHAMLLKQARVCKASIRTVDDRSKQAVLLVTAVKVSSGCRRQAGWFLEPRWANHAMDWRFVSPCLPWFVHRGPQVSVFAGFVEQFSCSDFRTPRRLQCLRLVRCLSVFSGKS